MPCSLVVKGSLFVETLLPLGPREQVAPKCQSKDRILHSQRRDSHKNCHAYVIKKGSNYHYASYRIILRAEQRNRNSDSLRVGRYGDRISVEARFSTPIPAGSWANSASCKMDTGLFQGTQRPRRDLTTQLHLTHKLKKV